MANGTTAAHEFMQIRERDGAAVCIAMPSGQRETVFPLVRSGDREATFENLAHDFPQRVIYRRTGDMLLGRIEGTQAGTPRSADFPMRRAACP